MTVSFQRKFKVKGDSVPACLDLTHYDDIEQFYWSLGPNWTLRYRITTSDSGVQRESVVVKGRQNGGEQRQFAFDLPAPDDASDSEARRSLRASAERECVRKRRFYFTIDGIDWRLDQFQDNNAGLWILETDSEAARSIPIPSWCERDVTSEKRYLNERLASMPMSHWT